ncbi:hypothetical protein LZ32DRAFT_602152 [Colletotrichum eremochloae]|nr:hypothetical protein LZ32DRAFT_602152 [Colletotrichum eremochloae]
MYTGHNPRSESGSAALSTASPLPKATRHSSAGPSVYNSATMAVAIVVALLLLLVVAAITFTEHRKKKASDALRERMQGKDSENLGHAETRGSLGSFDSAAGLKEPKPAARGISIGSRFALFYGNR